MEPVPIDSVHKLLDTCIKNSFIDLRDKTILLTLIDTGVRASELLAIDLIDINQVLGDILIRSGKGGKPRTVFIGKETRKWIRKYLSKRNDNSPALWVTDQTRGVDRLSYWGLRSMVNRRSIKAGICSPSIRRYSA